MYVHIYAYMHSISSGISVNIQKTLLDSFKLKLQYNAFDRRSNDIRSTLNKTLTRLMYPFLNLTLNVIFQINYHSYFYYILCCIALILRQITIYLWCHASLESFRLCQPGKKIRFKNVKPFFKMFIRHDCRID